ncbi:hypothetical protein ACCAA_810056 [Candidatus Accumulibacter aalborgensis]|uniref:Uncharacterized protein n=1 Tax=Candidatus Accumulibacter aalborgensis TaxID=1860102 RepID=A0A1A8XYJ5_9PROT|nr:hypothetical protein ACCAA_810056 [Candidatus Accumulibacter aalborgensis]
MAAAVVSPVDSLLPCYGLKLRDLSVQRVATHGNQELSGSIHRRNGTAGNITTQALHGKAQAGHVFPFSFGGPCSARRTILLTRE